MGIWENLQEDLPSYTIRVLEYGALCTCHADTMLLQGRAGTEPNLSTVSILIK